MPILDARHDLGHPVEGDTAWSESYYFNGFDPGSDSGLFTRIGIRPNEGTMDVGLSVWLPGGDLAEYRAVVEQHEMVDTDLVVGAVRYRMVEPMRSWHLAFDGDAPVRACTRGSARDHDARIRLDLRFDSLTPAVGTDGQGADRTGVGRVGRRRRHHRQGALRAVRHLDGPGGRSTDGATTGTVRSATATDRGAPATGAVPRCGAGSASTSTNGCTSAASGSAPATATCTGDGSPTTAGWPASAEWQVRTEPADDGLTQRTVHLTVVDKQGTRYDLRGDVLRVADIGRSSGTLINEGLTRWTLLADGPVRSGYGIAEYLHQLGDDGRPVVALE